MGRPKSVIFGVGINDADYVVQPTLNGKQIMCQFYQTWTGMLERCYSRKYHVRQPTYINCSACEEWHKFSNFKKWMERQDWQGKELDKDLLFVGNKVYSPEACVFVDSMTNNFTTDRASNRGATPIGVSLDKRSGKFTAQIRNPFTKKNDYLGTYIFADHAHKAWKKRKHELACQLADLQTDHRVAIALRLRYL